MKKLFISILSLGIFVVGGCNSIITNSNSDIATSVATTKNLDVSYGTDSDTQKMDIYIPEGTGPFPVIIAIHGGAFMMGNKEGGDLQPMLQAVKKGYAVVTVNYRLSNEAKFPAAIDDIQKAIVFIKENAKAYNLNGDKIATWGDSAGGNLASLAGTMGNIKDNTDVQAVVDRFGPIYFSTMDEEFTALGVTPKMGNTNSPNSPESKYLGQTIGTQEAEVLVKQASPQTYISKNSPAFFIQHGTLDTNIPITQSENFAEKLKNVIGDENVIFEKIEGAAHGGAQFETEENLNKVFNFLDTYLK
ncbi:MAG TPA: alpha/beta hydrolase [Candidatus Absconditabacterales bacterium]|nr:alpha/beta hydrolase [Candidatus Absconditabacterales bacterium]